MGTRADRLWLIGGVVAILLIAIGGWTLLISPKRTEADEVRSQTADQQTELLKLRRQVNDLKAKDAKLATFKAENTTLRQALPVKTEMTNFLRQLQASGAALNVAVSGVNVGTALKSTQVPTVWELPITLTISGSAADLSRFLTQLQSVQPREVLLSQVVYTAGADDTGGAGTTTTPGTTTTADAYRASVTMKAFVQPELGATSPTKN
jgi:Tfp pilus assembly protein PilO